jgi:hypothetical protein
VLALLQEDEEQLGAQSGEVGTGSPQDCATN